MDWEGNVYIIERDAHRIVKLSPKLDKFLLQLGTTNEKGNDATHFDLPSGIAVLKNGNIIVTDGYGNNRVVMFDKQGKFIKQVGKGAGGPTDKGKGPGEWDLPHKLAVDAQENLYIIDREGHRLQVFDKNLTYIREIRVEGWNPWDIGISRKGTDGFAFIADHALERIHKLSLKDGKLARDLGQAGTRARRVRLGPRRRRRFTRRGVRSGHLRSAVAEVRAAGSRARRSKLRVLTRHVAPRSGRPAPRGPPAPGTR